MRASWQATRWFNVGLPGGPDMKKRYATLLLPLASIASAEPVGEVDTVFKFVGPDHRSSSTRTTIPRSAA